MSRLRLISHVEVTTTVESSFYQYTKEPEKIKARRKELLREAQLLEEQIKRHCDVTGTTSINFIYDDTCEFCGYAWTEGDNEDNGGCCIDDERVIDKRMSTLVQSALRKPSE